MAKVTVSFSLDDEKDADILQDLAELPKRQKSAAFRAAWRARQAAARLTLGDVMNELGEIRRALRNGVIVQRNGENVTDGEPSEPSEPPDPLVLEVEAIIGDLGRVRPTA